MAKTIIRPVGRMAGIDWHELAAYRDLFFFLVARDIRVLYKQTVLGFAWAILRPVMMMLICTAIFGRLARLPSDGVPYPIFYFSALVPWFYFSSALTGSSDSLVANSQLMTKVYFPRLLIPATAVVAKLLDFAIALAVLAIMIPVYGMSPRIEWVVLPFLLCMMMASALGLGLWLSALGVQYRDVRHAMPFLIQSLFYLAPIVWPASLMPERFRLLYGLYPMAGVLDGFRSALLGTTPLSWDLIGAGTLSSALLLVSGAMYFQRVERTFADVA